jgi:hypothetical protein
MPSEWNKQLNKHNGRFDLVTFSFGGDDLGFQPLLLACAFRNPGCNDTQERQRVQTFAPEFRSFLNKVASEAVTPGGDIVIMGYPELFEDPSLWGQVNRDTHLCQGLITNNAKVIRGWAADLNATLGSDVEKVNAEASAKRNGVGFQFVDVVSANNGTVASDANLFEPSSGTRHELCSPGSAAWLNGLSLGTTHVIKPTTFHPNQSGETAMGNLLFEEAGHLSLFDLPAPLPAVPNTPQAARNLTTLLRASGLLQSQAPPGSCASIQPYGADFARGALDVLIGHGSAAGCTPTLPFGTVYEIRGGSVLASAQQCDCGQQSASYEGLVQPYGTPQLPTFTIASDGSVTTAPAASSGPSSTSTSTSAPTATTTSVPAPTSQPVLGSPSVENQHGGAGEYTGYGQAEPANFQGGGDSSTSLTNITWQSWGGAQATGTGTAWYYPPDGSAQTLEQATAVAFDLGTCPDGTRAYQSILWYFPEEGQAFSPSTNGYFDACNGQRVYPPGQ